MNLQEIARLVELMEKHKLTEFLVETEEIKLSLKREHPQQMLAVQSIQPMMTPPPAPPQVSPASSGQPVAPPQAAAVAAEETPDAAAETIDSPLVGTFYAAPAPDKPPYVKIGDEVGEDTVVCIVEAMKVMNEIKAERRGVITKVLVENAQPVEYGQPLFEVRPL